MKKKKKKKKEEEEDSKGISLNEEFSHEINIESTRMEHEFSGDATSMQNTVPNFEVAWSTGSNMQDKKVQIQFYCKIKLIAKIKVMLLKFGEDTVKLFKKGPFRSILKLPKSIWNCPQGINYVVNREMKFEGGVDETGIPYFINNTRVRFVRPEFAFITGLKFRKSEFDPNNEYKVEDKCLWHRAFGRKKVKVQDLLDRLLHDGNNLGDDPEDYMKAVKIVFVHGLLFGQDLKKTIVPEWIWVLVEFPHTWNNFPLGECLVPNAFQIPSCCEKRTCK